MPVKDRTNIRYGKLVAKKYVGDSKWLCQCDCGKEIIVHGNKLESGQQSCGCSRGPRKNLKGQRFGKLIALEYIPGSKWKCQCDCGNTAIVQTYNLTSGNTQSCGCLQKERTSQANFTDLTGKRFGRLLVIKRVENNKFNQVCYECQCDCGNITIVPANRLTQNRCKSCGCLRNELTKERYLDLLGQKFGKLTVIEKTDRRQQGSIMWKCQCDCGNIKEISSGSLVSGHTKSCGCSFSYGEENIIKILIDNKVPYLYNVGYFSELRSEKGRCLRFDFVLYPYSDKTCLIEFDGPQHKEFKNNWKQTEEEYKQAIKRDKEKNEYCLKNNIPLYRIPYEYRDKLTLELLTDEKFLVKEEL